MRAIFPVQISLVNQPHVGLVDQRRSLERVVRTLQSHVPVGQPVKFLMDERRQSVERRFVSIAPIHEQLGNLSGGRFHRAYPFLAATGQTDPRIIALMPDSPPLTETRSQNIFSLDETPA